MDIEYNQLGATGDGHQYVLLWIFAYFYTFLINMQKHGHFTLLRINVDFGKFRDPHRNVSLVQHCEVEMV